MFAQPQVHHGLDQPMQGNRWQPIKPKKSRRRKRSFQMFQETSTDDAADRAKSAPVFASNSDRTALSNIDVEHFMKPSTKRRRTNQMQTAKDQIPVLAQPALERDLYSHRPGKAENAKLPQNDVDSQSHADIESPYDVTEHPYHSHSQSHGLDALLHDTNKEKSPEKLFERMNLNGFEISNRENETVAEWKHSIEAQLNDARNGPSEVHELCRRIQDAQGLGRDVLVAKLRQRVGDEVFESMAKRMGL